jgi:hypothetical protein
MSDFNGDLLRADEKIDQGIEWTDTVSIPVAGEEMTFGFSLLNERTRQPVQDALPLDEFRDYQNDGMSEEQERLMELQRKDDMSDDEEEELLRLAQEVNPEEEGRNELGDEAVDALMEAGKEAFEPTDEDVGDILSAPPDVQQRIFGDIPEHLDRETAREELREYMKERLEDQPFPIKFILGQRAYMETVAVAGNGFQDT